MPTQHFPACYLDFIAHNPLAEENVFRLQGMENAELPKFCRSAKLVAGTVLGRPSASPRLLLESVGIGVQKSASPRAGNRLPRQLH